MSAPAVKIGCVVVTLRKDRDFVTLTTSDGDIEIEVRPIATDRARLVVRAPITIPVVRGKREEEQ
jgi:hypothetical protein